MRRGGARRFRSWIQIQDCRREILDADILGVYTATIPTATAEVGGSAWHSAGILLSKDFGKHHFDFNETAQWLVRPGASGSTGTILRRGVLPWSDGKVGRDGEIAGFSRTNLTTPATMTNHGAATYNWFLAIDPRLGCVFAVYGNLPRAPFLCVTYSVRTYTTTKEKNKKQIDRYTEVTKSRPDSRTIGHAGVLKANAGVPELSSRSGRQCLCRSAALTASLRRTGLRRDCFR